MVTPSWSTSIDLVMSRNIIARSTAVTRAKFAQQSIVHRYNELFASRDLHCAAPVCFVSPQKDDHLRISSLSTNQVYNHRIRVLSSNSEHAQINPNWETITNHQTSKTVKLFKSVHRANKSKRLELGVTVAEGVRLVTDILADEQSRQLVRRIVVSEDLLTNNGDENQRKLHHWLQVVHNESMQRKKEHDEGHTKDANKLCSINIGTEQVVAACAGTVTTQGVVALMEIPSPFNPVLDTSKVAPFYLILDGLGDPGNVGTLLRSCAASNVDALILLPNSCDVFNPKAVRSAMGASFRVPVLDLGDSRSPNSIGSFDEMLGLLQQCGVDSTRVFAATMEESGARRSGGPSRQSIPYYKVDWMNRNTEQGGAALILGKEGEGLRVEVCNAIQEGKISTVHVPMAPGTESLNAAVCGSVIMFERLRQQLKAKEDI